MSSRLDLVMLSLAPFSWRRALGDRLRAGVDARTLLEECVPDSPRSRVLMGRLPGAARSALDRAAHAGIAVVAWSDDDYPPALAAVDDPPPVLWVRGARSTLLRPAVALIGSRAGSPSALAIAEQLGRDLATAGLLVVSGLARGVDSAAHRGALSAAGATAAVLGSGADVAYPPEHRALADLIAAAPAGAIVSELAPGTRPHRWFFPLRNRIISGLSRAVVVIEAGEKSGSLITARCALDQGRDVLAVPGSVLGGRNRGGHALLRDGAKIVESADDILEELGLGPDRSRSLRATAKTREHDPVLAALQVGEACDLDAISAQSGLPSARILPRLFELELQGKVRRVGGGRFIRLDGSC